MNTEDLKKDPYLYFKARRQPPWTAYLRYNVIANDLVMIIANNETGEVKIYNHEEVWYTFDKYKGDWLYKIGYTNSAATQYDLSEDHLMSCLENEFLIHFGVQNGLKNYQITTHS